MNEVNEERLAWLRWVDRLSALLALLAGVAAFAMMTNIVIDVLGRTFVRPLPGTVDMTQFAWMPIVVSLGMGYALLQGQHIRVGLLLDGAGRRVQRIVEVLSLLITFAGAAGLAWYGGERAYQAIQMNEFPSATPWLPIAVFRWIMVAGLAMLAVQALAQVIRALVVAEFVIDADEFVDAVLDDEVETMAIAEKQGVRS